ncbi:hypothetical protein FYW06_21170 [Bacillus paranthracis]|uniref:Uncharacterized protein n=1 Tax=Bacillus paranthracis TaxID=2026186 RepID=A0A5M9GNB1_9BACI|nr:hypothetical protein EGX95_23820 [Bacillus sp. FDAARGOS_527]KAA8475830.1 hypothetical protein FYW06_21170 [Bacillus paranthracis]KAB7636115.1 hypothetical protein GBN96_15235 [Bacillus sp. B4-WWTP-NA-D-NA-NA]OUB97235.1 hypothetical protein BK752_15110 [Bacillus thuringiensis serovar canadensis]OXL95490.1 hypothetical protein B6N65_20350 [Bacillus sp. KbaB1]PSA76598.1 hypothetical protein B1995_16620 [Bacillus cereus]
MLQINWAEKAAITHYATFSAQKYSVIFRPYYASYPALTGSKTPTLKFGLNKEVRWEVNCP